MVSGGYIEYLAGDIDFISYTTNVIFPGSLSI